MPKGFSVGISEREKLFKALLKVFFFSPAMLAAKRQDGGLFKSPPYPGYPFIMIPDLTSPYLPNGSLSPTARTVSVFICPFPLINTPRRAQRGTVCECNRGRLAGKYQAKVSQLWRTVQWHVMSVHGRIPCVEVGYGYSPVQFAMPRRRPSPHLPEAGSAS